MRLKWKAYEKLSDNSIDLMIKYFGEGNPSDLALPIVHSNDRHFKDHTFEDKGGDIINNPKDTAFILLDNYVGAGNKEYLTVMDLNSTVLRNAANYYSTFADVVEQIEKDTNQAPKEKPMNIVSPSFIDLRSVIEEDDTNAFHMELNIPGATI